LRGAIKVGLAVGAAALTAGYVIVGDHSDYSVSSFSGTYNAAAADGDCDNTTNDDFVGYEPTAGTHPVFIWLMGSLGVYNAAAHQTIVETWAKRGFVAATADYLDDNGALQGDAGYQLQANCLYDRSVSGSLAATLCARARADCSKGLVVGGHSQGGALAWHATYQEPSIVAIVPIGTTPPGLGETINPYIPTSAGGNRTFPSSAVRLTNGEWEVEDNVGFAQPQTRQRMNTMVSDSCQPDTDPDETLPYVGVDQCLRADGSGWYLAPNGGPRTNADHCWIFDSGCSEAAADTEFLTDPPTQPWHLRSIIAWADGKTSE
jgi:hypothetical protein